MWGRRHIKIMETHKNKGFKGHQELSFQLNGILKFYQLQQASQSTSIAPSSSCMTFLLNTSLVLSQYKRDTELLESIQRATFVSLGNICWWYPSLTLMIQKVQKTQPPKKSSQHLYKPHPSLPPSQEAEKHRQLLMLCTHWTQCPPKIK